LRLSWLHIWLHAWLRSGFQRKEKKPLCGKGSRKKKAYCNCRYDISKAVRKK